MRKTIVVILSLWVLSAVLSFPSTVGGDPVQKDGNISFQPNVIPLLNVTDRPFDKPESFRFEWLGNKFDIELFFNATLLQKGVNVTKLWSLRDFEDDFAVSVDYQVHKNTSNVQFGWFIENVEDISSFVHNAWFKIEDTQPFDYEDIVLEEIEIFDNVTSGEPLLEPYNITRFHLPDNLVLSFEDLYHKGFIIGHQNKTATSVKGFSGKSSWNLDPVTFSSGVMEFTGTSSANGIFYDFWDASNTNGWGVAHNNNNSNTQFEYNCLLKIGNSTHTGTASDWSKEIFFPDGTVTTTYQKLIHVDNGVLTLGKVIDASLKSTTEGCVIIANEATYHSVYIIATDSGEETNLYSSTFVALSLNIRNVHALGGNVWNCQFQSKYNLYCGSFSCGDSDVFNCVATRSNYAFKQPTGVSINRIYAYSCYASCYLLLSSTKFTIKNLYARGCTYAVYADARGEANPLYDDYIINGDIDNWNIFWYSTGSARIYRQYEFDLTVQFPNGTAIQNANVTVKHYGQGETQDFTELTDSNGQIAQKTLLMGFYNQTGGNTIYNYNPYNITITCPDMETYTNNFTLDDKTEWIIALQEETPSGYNWFGVTIIMGIGMLFLFVIALTTKT